jgi:phage terminase small subunit
MRANAGNAADAYRKAYPRCKSAHAAETNGSLLLRNTEVAARISEILRRGAEHAEITVEQVLRELAKIGFSDIRKAVAWRNEVVEREEEGKGEDGVVRVTRVLLPRVTIVPSEMDPDIAAAIPQIWQGLNSEVRVRLHDKHVALVTIGKHLAS